MIDMFTYEHIKWIQLPNNYNYTNPLKKRKYNGYVILKIMLCSSEYECVYT